jgi:TRAP transporter 4TM/12TM fusion protein
MASVGFLMSEYTGISYVKVIGFILIPAVLYFVAVGIMVHVYAVRERLPVLRREELPRIRAIMLARGHLMLPLLLLVALLVAGRSPMFAVSYCIVAIVLTSWLRRETRMGPRAIWEALAQGSIQATIVAVAIIASAVMVGIFDLTGVAIKFSGLIVDLAGESLALALPLVMIATIVLGMGLPLSSAYIIQVGIAIPAMITLLQRAGFPETTIVPQAHLFVIFFSSFASITPPTAPTTYAAAAIAQSPIMPTAVEAMKLALPAFLLPYMFILDPSLLMLGTPLQIAVGAHFAVGGVGALAAALQGFAYGPLTLVQRALCFAAGVVMIGPTPAWHLSGAAIAGGVLLLQRTRWKARAGRAVDAAVEPGDKTAMTTQGRPGA